MIYLTHEQDTNSGSAGNADPPLPTMRAYVAATNCHRTADVPEVQIGLLGDGASTQDSARTASQGPWIARGSGMRSSQTLPETRQR